MDATAFYRRHTYLLLGLVLFTAPVLAFLADSIPSNNDLETWLPHNNHVRQVYEQFKTDFGSDESVYIALNHKKVDAKRIEALAGRLERLPGIKTVWTAERMLRRMQELQVDESAGPARLAGLVTSDRQHDDTGVVAILSKAGLANRAQLVADVRTTLDYCQFARPEYALTGAPVIVTELDALGNHRAGRPLFIISLAISLGLLYYAIGNWRLSLGMLGLTIWSIYLTQTIIALTGGEMNFIMGSLSIMVMIFTLSISIHFVSYYSEAISAGAADPLGAALRESLKPCALSTLTTLIGLCSLNASSIVPVNQFGGAAAIGSIVAFVVGLGLTPCLLVLQPNCAMRPFRLRLDFARWADALYHHRGGVLATAVAAIVAAGFGLRELKSHIDPVDFLPQGNIVLRDLRHVEQSLTSIDCIEAVVDFQGRDLSFAEQLEEVRGVAAQIRTEAGVRHVLSVADFFPETMPDSLFACASLLKKAKALQGDDGLSTEDRQLWRLSIRVDSSPQLSPDEILQALEKRLAQQHVTFTGMTPLLASAQREIFTGFWQSLTAAIVSISLVMLLALRSVTATLIAMVPNILPIWLVFGFVGYLGLPVDIGMMMTGSIAIGISVDCTFHFLVRHQEALRFGASNREAVRAALLHSGEPMLDSTIISSVSMLVLLLSSFSPTARFGTLMAAQMVASLLGELVLLPALLYCGVGSRSGGLPQRQNEPQRSQPKTLGTDLRQHAAAPQRAKAG